MELIRNINITTTTLFANNMKSSFIILLVLNVVLFSPTYAKTNYRVKNIALKGIDIVDVFGDSVDKKGPLKQNRRTSKDSLISTNCNHADTLSLIYKSVSELLEYQKGMERIKEVKDSILQKNKELNESISTIKNENLLLTQEKNNLTTSKKNIELEKNSAQQKLQNIDGQINSLVSFLNQSNYQTDAKIIETIMNIAKEQNQMASISQLKDFQSKSTAIKEAMVLLNGSKILKATELENLTNKLKTTYGKQNSLFSQLEKDYQLTLNLISKYSETACVLYISLQNALIDYKLAPNDEKVRLLRESIADVYQYDGFVTIIENAILTIPSTNPVQGINCD
jgi:hypothetical protein